MPVRRTHAAACGATDGDRTTAGAVLDAGASGNTHGRGSLSVAAGSTQAMP